LRWVVCPTHGNIDVGAKPASLHARDTGVHGVEQELNLADENGSRTRMVQVRVRDDFNQRHADAVKVKPRHIARLCQRLGRVLLQLDLLDAHGDTLAVLCGDAISCIQSHVPIFGERFVVLGDLIPRGLVPPKVMFPVESADALDVAIQGESRSEGREQHFFLYERLAAGHGHVEEGNMTVGFVIERCGGR